MKQIIFIAIGLMALIGIGLIIVFFIITSKPNPKDSLKMMKVSIRGHIWEAEIARSLVEKARGLSGRESLGKNKAMIFPFDSPSRESFWMKGMNFPIDMIWIMDKKILNISKNAQPLKDNLRPLYYSSKDPIDMVLEINANQVDEFNLQIGDAVDIKP